MTTSINFNWLKLNASLMRLVRGLGPERSHYISYVEGFLMKVKKISTSCGFIFLINYLKNAKLALSKHLSGDPLHYVEGRVGLDKDGLPKVIPKDLRKKILDRDTMAISFTYTLLSISRLIPVTGVPKLSTITDPFIGKSDEIDKFIQFINTRFNPYISRRFSKGLTLGEPELLPSVRSGPTGVPAVAGVFLDIANLFVKNCDVEVRTNLYLFTDALGGKFKDFFDNLLLKASQYDGKLPDFNQHLSRLHELPDKEAKVRIIAIMDGITQSVLFPIHKLIFSLLKKIENDFTHDQRSAVSYIVNRFHSIQNKGGNPRFYCYDLSAATDRLPLSVQAPIVGGLLGKASLGDYWARLISSRNFIYNGRSIRYAVGQPMGAYSSFASLAITHHCIVQYAWWSLGGRGWCKDYTIVGDDIVILTTPLALKYKDIMASIGVPINDLKTFESAEFFEFCKRYNYLGHDVSPFPIALLLKGGTNNTVSFWKEVSARGIVLSHDAMPFKVRKVFEFPTVNASVGSVANWVYKYTHICPCVHGDVSEVTRWFLDSLLHINFQRNSYDVSGGYDTNIILPPRYSWVPQFVKIFGFNFDFVQSAKSRDLSELLSRGRSLRTVQSLLEINLDLAIRLFFNIKVQPVDFNNLEVVDIQQVVQVEDLSSSIVALEEGFRKGVAIIDDPTSAEPNF